MKRLLALAPLPLLLLSLTSCEAHWFGQSYDVPWYAIVIPSAILVIGVCLWAGSIIARRRYRCSACGSTFHPNWYAAALSVHVGARRVFRCPHCGHKGFCAPTHEE